MSTTLFVFVLLVLVVNVWVVNFRRRKHSTRDPAPLPEERPVARVVIDDLLATTRGRLTTHRVLSDADRWWMSRRETQAVLLEDVHSVVWQVQLNRWMLLFGALLSVVATPWGLLVVLYALQTPFATVGFQSHFLPTTLFEKAGLGVARAHVLFRSGKRTHYQQLQEFYEAGVDAWSKARSRATLPAQRTTEGPAAHDQLFKWSPNTWLSVWTVLFFAYFQRAVLGHVVVDDPVFGALYLALPLVVAMLEGLREGLSTALLTFLMLLAVKFPAGSMIGAGGVNDGVFQAGEAAVLFLGVLLIVLLGSLLHRSRFAFLPAELAVLAVWPALAQLKDPGSVGSLRTWALILMALGFTRLLYLGIPGALASRWLKSLTNLTRDLVDVIWGATA